MPKEQGADCKHDYGTRLEGEVDSFASQTARETSLAKKTGEIFSGVGRQAQTSYSKAMENEKARSSDLPLTIIVQSSLGLQKRRLFQSLRDVRIGFDSLLNSIKLS